MAKRPAFPGGIHPQEGAGGKASTAHTPIRQAEAPVRVVIQLTQHSGKPCTCQVREGDRVDMGQVIGCADGPMSVNTHSSVSGTVVSVTSHMNPAGINTPTVVIDNDFEERWHESVRPRPDADSLSAADMADILRECGVVGLGGALFPTAIKLSPPADQPVDTVILNGAECEPYLSCDHRTMLEAPEKIIDGLRLAMKMVGAARGMIGIEDNKPDAIEALTKASEGTQIQVVGLPVRYPQGGEKQLIYALTGRKVPEGCLPFNVGVIVMNVSTSAAVSGAIRENIPLIERVVTMGGRIVSPANLRVKIGTTIVDLIDECGGMEEGVRKVVAGGPMMGNALARLDFPITKGHSGILALGKESYFFDESPCMKCGRCVETCPMRLVPTRIDAAARRRMWQVANDAHVMSCLECGSCTFACPAKRQLTQNCRTAKAGIRANLLAKR